MEGTDREGQKIMVDEIKESTLEFSLTKEQLDIFGKVLESEGRIELIADGTYKGYLRKVYDIHPKEGLKYHIILDAQTNCKGLRCFMTTDLANNSRLFELLQKNNFNPKYNGATH